MHTFKPSTLRRQRQEDQEFKASLGYLKNWPQETCLTPKKKSSYYFCPGNHPRQAPHGSMGNKESMGQKELTLCASKRLAAEGPVSEAVVSTWYGFPLPSKGSAICDRCPNKWPACSMEDLSSYSKV